MRWVAVAWSLVVVAGCGGAPGGSNQGDDGSGATNPLADASMEPGGDGGGSGGDGGGSGGGGDAPMPPQAQVLADDCGYMDFMRADATHLYWACDPGVTVRRMPLAGGSVETLYTGSGWTNGLAVDGGFVYIAETHGNAGNDLVVRVPVTGGAPVTLVTTTGVRTLDVDNGWVYYSDTPDWPARVLRIPVNGGTPHFLARARAGSTPFDLIANAGAVFFTDSYAIMRLDVQTKHLSDLATNLLPTGIAVDDQLVYFVSCTTSDCLAAGVYRVPRSGGAVEALGTGQSGASKVSVIDDSLQWGSHVISLSGTAERTLLDSQSAFVVTATSQAFYLGERATGVIYRVAR